MKRQNKNGFTIIEVVLVLAIAGLIFLMVFVALPALQRSQRDTQRRNDYAMLAASMTDYLTNNNGNLPTGGTATNNNGGKKLNCKMLNSDCKTPDGGTYEIYVINPVAAGSYTTTNIPTETKAVVYPKAKCSDSAATNGALNGYTYPVSVDSSRAYAIMGYLESGYYCQDNS